MFQLYWQMRVARGFHSRFLSYLHAALYSGGINIRSIKQTTGIQNLDSQAYLDEMVPLPPLNEQTVVATFLDRETAKIDALIAKKQRLIELLQEKREALISHVINRGMSGATLLKNSGTVEWGDIPHDWELKQLRH